MSKKLTVVEQNFVWQYYTAIGGKERTTEKGRNYGSEGR